MTSVLVVDDQARARDLLGAELVQAGFAVSKARDGEEGWRCFCAQGPDVVITDMQMPECDGIELLRRIRTRSDVPVIVFTGHGSIRNASVAFKAGAHDFVSSVEVDIEDLVHLVEEAVAAGHFPSPSEAELEQRLAGTSSAASRIRWQLTGLAPLHTPVLISGETGTGRTTAVRALHELGSTFGSQLRRVEARNFRTSHLGELGALHIADVEQLPLEAQAEIAARLDLRGVPAASSLSASSSPPPSPANLPGYEHPRLLATTAAPLASLARNGAFDEKLARALLRFHVEIPPLRDRTEDVPAIAQALLIRIGASVGRTRVNLSPAAMKLLTESPFPENIRQLERLLERATAYSVGRVIRRQTLEDLMAEMVESVASMREERLGLERERLIRTLQETGGNITHTADLLEKSRAAVYRLIDKYDIQLRR